MGLKLHHVKALPKWVNELFEKNWLSAILLRDNSPSSTVFEILAFLCFAIFA